MYMKSLLDKIKHYIAKDVICKIWRYQQNSCFFLFFFTKSDTWLCTLIEKDVLV